MKKYERTLRPSFNFLRHELCLPPSERSFIRAGELQRQAGGKKFIMGEICGNLKQSASSAFCTKCLSLSYPQINAPQAGMNLQLFIFNPQYCSISLKKDTFATHLI